jgi:N-acetylglutamate synthase-like GNAT family acetyltransferase
MEVRYARNDDVPAIVELLKKSLGESLMPKTESFWNWKHLHNPFGPSPVLLATDKDKIVGVRAFMRWEWKWKDQLYKSVRAVDTATHPDYQGKGIFKKLTLQLVDKCKEEGIHFIFNTPNDQSRPGYLKMGWEQAGRLPISVKVLRPFLMCMNFLGKTAGKEEAGESVSQTLPDVLPNDERFTTAVTPAYLRWRYQMIPNIRYHWLHDSAGGGLLIYRIKPGKLGNEVRICDIFANGEKAYSNVFALLHRSTKGDYMTASGLVHKIPGILSATVNKGPVVTVRNLNMGSVNELTNFKHWSPALGDLELF